MDGLAVALIRVGRNHQVGDARLILQGQEAIPLTVAPDRPSTSQDV
jgi:hypothetical protein